MTNNDIDNKVAEYLERRAVVISRKTLGGMYADLVTEIFNDINKRRETNEYKRNRTWRKTAKKMD